MNRSISTVQNVSLSNKGVWTCSIVSVALHYGTTRYSLVTPEVVITHTGLSGNMRILVAASERLAGQHKYTFDENIDTTIYFSYLVCSRRIHYEGSISAIRSERCGGLCSME
jgi:hypothetical protein